ncbi:helix-turn-helix transcriptional regulator [Glutamicibacter protophormiae]|uniref:DNA-binding CsgD family transcriptional regulator n=1 Tax=Glutamicibacter protophormiae TaxID=37930 RepID=A0ABS4XQ04_GLUPR|nr:helix-turn-helix transcriptional regulator [Glutamicibacter protophormiae]MBP2398590.1 DNA-binding CsgD family transcriptional regulator [Glutamicibacter protophormiae]GGM02586.1 hypothetical protein GCM10010038_35810 [Glutamicibacter protophormiae]
MDPQTQSRPPAEELVAEILWDRIAPSLDPEIGLLLIYAPQESNRHRVALRWLDGQGELINVGIPPEEIFDKIAEQQMRAPNTRIAVILPADFPATKMLRHFNAHVVDFKDLFLTASDISTLTGEDFPDAERLWQLTGGWPGCVRSLLADSSNQNAAVNALRRAALPWIGALDPEGILRECAFLPELTEDLMVAFYGDRYPNPPSISALSRAAMAQRSLSGDWAMPELLRQVIIDDLEWREPQRAQWLHEHAIESMHAAGRTGEAVRSALGRHSWRALSTVLVDGWVDLFTTEPRLLFEAGTRLPRWATRRSQIYGPAMKIAAAAVKDRMVIPFPTTEPDYLTDQTAQLLREHTIELYRQPKSEAIFAGLVELGILRFHGHYGSEGADAARRLRRAVRQATAAGNVRPSLAAMAELHAGMSMDIANERPAAAAAYESAWSLAEVTENHFIAADAASKLSLVHAQEGNTRAARRWLVSFRHHHSKVRWGSAMVGRAAELAEAFVAFAELDIGKLGSVLGRLPDEPDNDEFWAVHALLLAIHAASTDRAEAAHRILGELVLSRPYAANSPMAGRALHHAAAFLGVEGGFNALNHQGASTIPASSPELIATRALYRLYRGDRNGALAVLAATPSLVTGARHDNLIRNTRLAARYIGALPEGVLEDIAKRHAVDGELIDLAPFWMSGSMLELEELLQLTSDQLDRLKIFMPPTSVEVRPVLTDRELSVLAGLRADLSRGRIAEELFVSPNTVKSQISSLYRKLDVNSKAEALKIASHWGY